jgi:hypothetical protein
MADYEVVCEAVRAQAKKWDALAAETTSAREYAKSAVLGETAFLIIDPTGLSNALTFDNPIRAIVLKEAYQDIQERMATLLEQAVTEFEQVGDALIRVAVEYEQAEEICEVNLNEIYTA